MAGGKHGKSKALCFSAAGSRLYSNPEMLLPCRGDAAMKIVFLALSVLIVVSGVWRSVRPADVGRRTLPGGVVRVVGAALRLCPTC